MGFAAMDVELHALDVLTLRAVEVHVEVAEIEFSDFPLQCAGFHPEVNESAHRHVAADSRNAVQIKSLH
jgi:hypothetical protein